MASSTTAPGVGFGRCLRLLPAAGLAAKSFGCGTRSYHRAGRLLAACFCLFMMLASAPGRSTEPAEPSMSAARDALAQERKDLPKDAGDTTDPLDRILRRGELRVGLRTDYPAFSVRDDNGHFDGFEADMARAIAEVIGVRLVPVAVTPKSRIPAIASGDIDVVIATLGHDVLRSSQVSFITPHYYASHTAVIGVAGRSVTGLDNLVGRTVCLTTGASSNILFAQHHVRVLAFENPHDLLDGLRLGRCEFIVHDDTFFATELADPEWSSRYEIQYAFAPMPWGMAVAQGSTRLANVLSLVVTGFHQNGLLLRLAKAHNIDQSYLRRQQALWSNASCLGAAAEPIQSCVEPPVATNGGDQASSIAGLVTDAQDLLSRWTGQQFDLGLLKSATMLRLLIDGITYSLILVTGSLVATALIGVLFGRAGSSRIAAVRVGISALMSIGQTTPMPLLMFFGYVVAGGLTQYSAPVSLFVAITVLGFYNGCYVGVAIRDARRIAGAPGALATSALVLAWPQIAAFLINATKASPSADLIGVPEFLSVLTDLTAYSRDRLGVYIILLIFYSTLVLITITGLSFIRSFIARQGMQRA